MMKLLFEKILLVCLIVLVSGLVVTAKAQSDDPLDKYNVIWESPSVSEKDSMPIGNGEIGLNLWVEEDGDLLFYISRTDSWGDNARLLKLGRIRVKLSPNPFAKGLTFRQELKLRQGEIVIAAGKKDSEIKLKVWVDANNPVIHVDAKSESEFDIQVEFETWRETGYKVEALSISDAYNVLGNKSLYPTIMYPDVIVPGEKDRILWYHHNIKSAWPTTMKLQGLESLMKGRTDPLLGRTFGGAIKGNGLVTVSDRIIKSSEPANRQSVSIYVIARHPVTVTEWINDLDKTIERIEKADRREIRKAHRQWWSDFWDRSWIRITGSEDGQICSTGYTLQRYMHACGGRGNYPIKFNGSIFTTPTHGDPDWRQWGPGFWFQNQRLAYWSLPGSGDFDLMEPFFNMYSDALDLSRAYTKLYFNHKGAHFPETIFFWGTCTNDHYGWDRTGVPDSEVTCKFVALEWQGGLELLAIMYDYYSYTQDAKFLKETMLPMADEIITFFDEHYKRDDNGKLHIWPAQALETWWDCTNPMPEVAGLKYLLQKFSTLPKKSTSSKQRKQWKRLLGEVPAIPMRELDNGKKTLSPAKKFDHKGNIENPELYAVFPYRLYGVNKPELDMAKLAFEHRWHKMGNLGHDQDDIHAAYVGLGELAGSMLTKRFGTKHLTARFPTYWMGVDWIPDHCHGGVGLIALQVMLMQCDDKEISLFPAWPKDWDVEFKLHAPYNTTVEGVYRDGKLQDLKVTPKSRAKDVVKMNPQ